MPELVLLDSISYLGPEHAGAVVVSGSHGGEAAARYALAHPPLLVVFNDAGVGKDQAGIAGLALLEAAGIAACAVGHLSARISDAKDTLEHGVITHANRPARRLGAGIGEKVRTVVERLCDKA
ncbi:hypothetical protein [Calidithermus chliarophilus]|uniref:hypothetical protein n=1 Tax=Calidithermus chliarophilus TaxID=52023 RepID=UPI000415EF4F|nr:hypothetical protein [Calidithermus chliarophilus]